MTTVLERQFAAFELPPEVQAVVYGDDGYATAMLAFPASARWACVDVELSAGYPSAPPVVLVTASSDDAMFKEAVARAASATSPPFWCTAVSVPCFLASLWMDLDKFCGYPYPQNGSSDTGSETEKQWR
jgi:hypothetical protein